MAEIHVESAGEGTWRVRVAEGGSESRHEVTVSEAERERFGGGAGPEALLEESFRFLLEREPKESIMARFPLSTIARFFPEYPEAIRERLGTG